MVPLKVLSGYNAVKKFIFFQIFLFMLMGCQSKPDKIFTKLTSSNTGIDFNNLNEETPESNILTYEYYYNGGGVAAGDINNDGLTDLYFTSNKGENKLYLNQGNFRFKDITEISFTGSPGGWKTGVSMVDVNADGWLDIYVSRSGPLPTLERANVLYINNHDLTFKESAWRMRLNDQSQTTQTAFFDYDRDGDLDAFLLNHSLLSISYSYNINRQNELIRYPHVGNKLLRNDDGKFADVSDSIGIFGPASNYGLGVSLSDINNDGWIDIYAGCDYTGRDRLLLNLGGQSFQDATDSLLSHISKFTMGTDITDVNNDGLMDIFTVDMLPEDNYRQKQLQGSDRYDEYSAMVENGLHHQCMRNMLHLNNGNGTFSEVGQMLKISNTDWSWAALFADYDNDGVQDLFVTNGFKRDLTNNDFAKFKAFEEIKDKKSDKKTGILEAIGKFTENKISNYIFKGDLDSAYSNKTSEWGLSEPTLSNGAAYADLDNDGDLDLITNNINSEAGIYRNNSETITHNNFLKVRLTTKSKNTQAIGAKVTVYAGNKMQVRELLPVRGFQSSVEPVLHFGLGKISAVDSIVVQWPDGTRQTSGSVAPNQLITIEQSNTVLPTRRRTEETLFRLAEGGLPSTEENRFVDFRVQALLPRMYSHEGPAFAQGDFNNDGISDFYLGGAAGKDAKLLAGSRNGSYVETNVQLLREDKASEDVDALFFDADGDKDQDLYVVTGGYENSDSLLLQDKLYINNGNAMFSKGKLPDTYAIGSCVRAADVDADGDQDLFVGARVIHGKYPLSPESTLLINNGNGQFLRDEKFASSFGKSGMVAGAAWTDLNNDQFPDLILVGEWMPVTVLMNQKGTFTESTSAIEGGKTEGFWNCIVAHDFDKDGDEDFILGNQGMNSQISPSLTEPVSVFFADYDKNGSVDPILNYYIQHKPFPYPSRDELAEQLPSFKKRFTNYDSYSKASIENILTPDELNNSGRLNAFISETCYLKNDNGKLKLSILPKELQFAPVYAIGAIDINRDGYDDLITGGNMSSGRARTGKMTGNCGFVFLNDGKGHFTFIKPSISGIGINGDVRKIIAGKNSIYFALNDGKVMRYELTGDSIAEEKKN
jgi:enediyne biosynthesis protein E4